MSRFKIYQIDHYDPRIVGQKKRRLALFYGAATPVFILSFQIGVDFLQINFVLLLFTLVPLILALYLYMHFKLKSDLKQIKTIGDIEFTRTGIKKRIGDSVTEYEFQSIEKLELQKHIPDVTPGGGKSGYFSYILKIMFINASTESLVISDRPLDKRQNLSIVETMKTLKKLIQPQISIKS